MSPRDTKLSKFFNGMTNGFIGFAIASALCRTELEPPAIVFAVMAVVCLVLSSATKQYDE